MEESTGGAGGKERRVTFRMEGGDYDALCERCERAGLSKSEYLRYLVRIPLSTEANAGDEHRILVDRRALWAMSRELTKWGYHYNQAVHAMNLINFHARHGRVDRDLVAESIPTIERELADVNAAAREMAAELGRIGADHVQCLGQKIETAGADQRMRPEIGHRTGQKMGQPLGQRQNALGRSQTGRVRHRVGGFHHLQALGQPFGAWGNMRIARHHQARQRGILRPQSFQRLRHGAAGLACAQHQRAALGRLGQMTRQTLDGQGIAHRHVIQMTQKASRVLLGNRRCRGLRARGCILCLHSCALCIRAFFPYRGPPVTTLLIFAIPMLQALAPIGFARLRTAFCT
mgnify:CR=1 FL=1